MARLSVGFFVASSIVALACQNLGGGGPTTPPGQPGAPGAPGAPGYGAPPGYGQPAAYGQPPAYPGYPQPQPGYPAQPGYAPQPGYPQPGAQPGYPQPGAPGPAPAAGGVMSVPGPAAFPCNNDSACGLAHCNTQNGPDGKPYNKCAFPCADANVDCIAGAACLAGFCVPKPPGS